MEERIKTTITDGVADVRLVRSDKMNALDDAMFMALLDTGEKLKADKSVRAVVVSGEGRAFCAGLDMGNFGRMASGERDANKSQVTGRLEQRTHGIANRAQYAALVWRDIPVPVIAAVHGVAFGGGFQVALGADMRFVAPGTRFSVMEIKWGLVPDMAGMALMRTLAREDVIRDLTYTGRIFEAEEALKLGFATRLCEDPYADALATAREIADKSPSAIRAAKRILNAVPDSDAAAILMSESVEQDKLIGGTHQKEAIMANLEKRRPQFAD
ncbi:crotonase/enoyl-CoA hydratase family protein [Parvibaculum sp.]|jgi:enoyl-CoA hydratase/carnithine racemase|uniref:crotonase/enoyl-CoA hydratase family protein n=1 Tax=Parvibaculum sp. TaxID=2024848 RepID=UPI001B2EA5CB|nr:crotonase/enoyl-CoA hydratase family protein [Parvibaculum sp.]MBO6636018.1 crotonase/enoyl-CoA hydratase family protein [Parvibaculum sp.]MBO6680383.1 crotonase/enoyl-CoA hydratase family protein [Parvibaculum sp.]MBO6686256.1 crotonase/enoyl-CoA hydratase family protein [Parvibaculum sp.]MBO6904989.1 crotonase/enoyl-CoA hydratase family protein [Parvibaculum sp.]